MINLTLGVHDLVDLVLRKGDLDNRYFNLTSMAEGTRLHNLYQLKNESENYEVEVPIKGTIVYKNYEFNLNGRIDCLIKDKNNYIIEEIKTTNDDIETFFKNNKEWHLGQALIYSYFILEEKELDQITIQLTYISQLDPNEIQKYYFSYSKEKVQSEVNKILEEYIKFYEVILSYKGERDKSIEKLEFPFSILRKGQREAMEFCYFTIQAHTLGFLQAPTGIGKTIATLFPFVKYLGEKHLEKIFYLTSKNSIKEMALKTVQLFIYKKAKIKAISLTSKEKICLNNKKGHCNPDECPFAKNYYNKINKLILHAIEEENIFNECVILKYAEEFEICPFEFQLDLSNYLDVVIGDYNYLFNPTSHLIRFFDINYENPYLLLIDEAHNLPSRVRDMYSTKLELSQVLFVKNILKSKNDKKSKLLLSDIDSLLDIFKKYTLNPNNNEFPNILEVHKIPEDLLDVFNSIVFHSQSIMKKNKNNDDWFLDFYYQINTFLNLPSEKNTFSYYFTFNSDLKTNMSFSIDCLDSIDIIKNAYDYFLGGVVFSATLSPKPFFKKMLGGNENSPELYLDSPFDKSNRLVLIDPFISTKYKDRYSSLNELEQTIESIISQKVGNYFVFFPSFEYLNLFRKNQKLSEKFQVLFQNNEMSNKEREDFLAKFVEKPTSTVIGFLILGGIFSEGIDLINDRLIASIIISVGLPKKDFKLEALKKYYKKESNNDLEAYNDTYVYPSINRLFQAAGRVIRSENDKGLIIFIDTRYVYKIYLENLKENFPDLITLKNKTNLGKIIKNFWMKFENE